MIRLDVHATYSGSVGPWRVETVNCSVNQIFILCGNLWFHLDIIDIKNSIKDKIAIL
jgi:hypothetical protein